MGQGFELLAPPPREVPWALRINSLMGGVVPLMGWAFLGFGMIFFWVFVADSELVTMLRFAGPTEHTRGIVTLVERTGASENEETIYAVRFAYDSEEGRRPGVSYALGERPPVGERVEVEVSGPAARITGLRYRKFSAWVSFVLVFPLIGLGMVLGSVLRRRHWPRLLVEGRVARGKLVKKIPTRTSVNDRQVYALSFEFRVEGRHYLATARSHVLAELTDEAEEAILYDPQLPERCAVVDAIPGRLRVGPGGALVAGGFAPWLSLVLPAVVIVVHGMIGLLLFL